MSRQKTINDNEAFICEHCGRQVLPAEIGTKHRNHCPYCLWSRHVDLRIGDRRAWCRGLMEPIGIWVKDRREWSIIHRCHACGIIRTNRIAGDDSETLLFWLAARPLTQLPFPADAALLKWEIDILNKGEKV